MAVPTVFDLGAKCAQPNPITIGNLYQRCGKSEQISVAVYSSYTSVTGKPAPAPTHVDSYGVEHAEAGYSQNGASEVFRYPATRSITLTHARSGQYVNEQVVYADGPYLWIKTVNECGVQFPSASLLIVDRRLSTDSDDAFVREALGLKEAVRIQDNRALSQALEAVPTIAPKSSGNR